MRYCNTGETPSRPSSRKPRRPGTTSGVPTLLLPAGWTCLCLLLFVSGCARAPLPPPAPEVIYQRPPAATMLDTPAPQFDGENGGDLLRHVDAWRAALSSCNAKTESLRTWSANLGKGEAAPAK